MFPHITDFQTSIIMPPQQLSGKSVRYWLDIDRATKAISARQNDRAANLILALTEEH
jgi:hypothetical protein